MFDPELITMSIDVLQKRPTTPTLKKHTITYLRERTNSFTYTLGVLRTLERQARSEIARLGGNEGLERIMDAMHVEGPAGPAGSAGSARP
jgi:geranylgeranyl diphosphate synthase type 3